MQRLKQSGAGFLSGALLGAGAGLYLLAKDPGYYDKKKGVYVTDTASESEKIGTVTALAVVGAFIGAIVGPFI